MTELMAIVTLDGGVGLEEVSVGLFLQLLELVYLVISFLFFDILIVLLNLYSRVLAPILVSLDRPARNE